MNQTEISDLLGNYLDTLTDEEKERYRDLIAESMERDRQITRDAEAMRGNLERLAAAETGVIETLTRLDEVLTSVEKTMAGAYLGILDREKMKRS